MRRIILLMAVGLLVFESSPVFSHYLWTTVENDSGKFGITNLYFEDKPKPGIGEYFQPFVDGAQTWVRTLQADSLDPLRLIEVKEEGNWWLSAELSQLGPRSVETYAKWGVYRYEDTGTDTLLHYYAKHLDVNSSESLQALGAADNFLLDIIPDRYVKPSQFFPVDVGVQRVSNFINRWIGPSVEIRIRWKGQPAVEKKLEIRGPGKSKTRLVTDKNGYVRFQAPQPGLYAFVIKIDEREQQGVDQGKTYDVVRHVSTLTLKLPIEVSQVEVQE